MRANSFGAINKLSYALNVTQTMAAMTAMFAALKEPASPVTGHRAKEM
jgi:hypothetical protein